MATDVTKTTLKTYFQAGDKPSQSNFTDLIESNLNLADATAQTVTSAVTLSSTLTVTDRMDLKNNIKFIDDGEDHIISQHDGIEVARIFDGSNLPTATGTSTAVTSGNTGQGGFGFRRMVINVGSGNDDNVVPLTANQSGAILFVTPTNALSITLPAGIPGLQYKVVIADKIDKAFTIKTNGAGSDNNDNFYLHLVRESGTAGDIVAADVDGDTLTLTNALEGSFINLTCLAGGANEIWLAEVKTTDDIAATVADS